MTERNGSNGSPSGHFTRGKAIELVSPRAMPDIAPSVHDQVKAALLPVLADWCRHVCEGVRNGERNGMNLWAKAMGVVGADVEINVGLMLTRELGVGTIEEAKRKLNMVSSIEGIDRDSAMSIMEVELRAWYAERGKRLLIMSEAEEVLT